MNPLTVRAVWAQAHDAAGEPVLGKDGGMPWHVPEDLAHFVRVTTPHPIIIGRATWDSIPPKYRPFANRFTIVLTRNESWEPTPASTPERPVIRASTPEEALTSAQKHATNGVIIVGGGEQIFHLLEPQTTEYVVTELNIEVDGDRRPPKITNDWTLTETSDWHTSKNGIEYRFRTYRRA